MLGVQKLLHVLQCLVQSQLEGFAAWPRAGEAQLVPMRLNQGVALIGSRATVLQGVSAKSYCGWFGVFPALRVASDEKKRLATYVDPEV